MKRQKKLGSAHDIKTTPVHLTETIKEALNQGKYSCGIFVDLQKAFDTVDHNILLSKLGTADKKLSDFLTDFVC